MSTLCARCERPTADGYACTGCRDRAWWLLIGDPGRDDRPGLVELAEAARAVAQGLARGEQHGTTGKPGSRLPLDLMATAKLDGVQAALTRWCDHIGPIRGTPRPWFSEAGDPIAVAASWLAQHVEWIRHRPEAGRFLEDVAAASRIVGGIARGPAEQKYLGPCGSTVTWDENGAEQPRETPCDGDVYAWPGATDGTCRTCKARWLAATRRAWLDEQTEELAAPARDIAHALDISVKTIRSWAADVVTDAGHVVRRAKLRTFYRAGEHVVPWADRQAGITDVQWKAETERRGPRLHYVGDVRQLAREAAERRAANETKRDATTPGRGAA